MGVAGTWDEVLVTVPPGATRIDLWLHPTLDWDFYVCRTTPDWAGN